MLIYQRPSPNDHKYKRGVVGLYTGSLAYPGAAVLGVGAALRTGAGLVRYVGPRRCQDLVLNRYPEALVQDGKTDVWVVGSGLPILNPNDAQDVRVAWMHARLTENVPLLLDAGALSFARSLTHRRACTILTPHAGELATLLHCSAAEIHSDPVASAQHASRITSAYVVLKGHTTTIAAPDGSVLQATSPTTWLATGGTGDALAGLLGTLLAQNHSHLDDRTNILNILHTGCTLHAAAAQRASERYLPNADGPITVLDLIDHIPTVIAQWLSTSPTP